jgi:hypothetical protein
MRPQSVSISSILFSTSSHDFAEKNVTLQFCTKLFVNNFGSPVKIIFARDGIHLSEEGMPICVTNIKFAIRRSLKLENMRRRRSVQTYYGKSNQKQFPLKCTNATLYFFHI